MAAFKSRPAKAASGCFPCSRASGGGPITKSPPANVGTLRTVREIIEKFARRAYRGQRTPADVDRLLTLFDRATEQKKSYGDSVRVMLKAVLVSPKFLYRIERDAPDANLVKSSR